MARQNYHFNETFEYFDCRLSFQSLHFYFKFIRSAAAPYHSLRMLHCMTGVKFDWRKELAEIIASCSYMRLNKHSNLHYVFQLSMV